ncbi:universal stress protein [Nocardia stercoris]|uniref:Universal stress protein n=1 Tax=Nocardia stercoris TaxID=2483361 RepID=A0A3M2LAG9_9NOCA|nr:universal stress protein [Nocardia stercoris]RMI33563.1 universal stress protein [Nocardia stercoris]
MTDNTSARIADAAPPVVAAVDGSATSYRAAAWAAVDAALHRWPLQLVISVGTPSNWGPGASMVPDDDPWVLRDAERILVEATRIAKEAVGVEPITIDTHVTMTPIIPYLLERSRHARAVVLGSRGLGAFRASLLGSVSATLVRQGHCPITVVRDATATDPASNRLPILVGVDGGPTAMPALEYAFEQASHRKVDLIALHAWTDVSGGDPTGAHLDQVEAAEATVFAESMAGWTERYPDVSVERRLVHDRPAEALLDASEIAQLVVIGSHGRGGFTGMLLGSTGNALVPAIDCPITVVRAPH